MIRFAQKNDIDNIMKFIDNFWRKNHILGVDKDFFYYEHFIDNRVTYVLSENDNKEIEGILGYIPYGSKNRDVMTVMWKVNKTGNPVLGISLLEYLIKNGDIRIIGSVGINPKTAAIYNYLGYKCFKMKHFYRLNDIENYKIAGVKNKSIPDVQKTTFRFENCKTIEELKEVFDYDKYLNSNPKPKKELWYFEKRYFNHPIYKYNIFALVDKKTNKSDVIFVLRLEKSQDSCALRFIDCIGDFEKIKYATSLFDELIKDFNAEYIDCYEYGIDDSIFTKSGWSDVDNSENIIPNYFSPYVKENIDINCFCSEEDVVLFKGDCDQDRPNSRI